jgi:hypothetical protein
MEQQQEQQTQEKKSNKTVLIVIIIVVMIGAAAAVYFFTQSEETTNTATTTNATPVTNTAAVTNTNTTTESDSTTNARQYDGKVINVSSADGKIEGLAGVKIAETDGSEYVTVGFFFKIHDTFSQKSTNLGSTHYSLLANHIKSSETRVDEGGGTVGGIYCEKNVMPDILEITSGNFNDQTRRYIECTYGTTDAWEDTDTFYHTYVKPFGFSVFTLEDIYEISKLEIYDASQYWVEEMYEGLESAGIDEEAAVANAPILATYTLEYEEQ